MDHYLHPDRKSQPGSASRNAEPIQEAVIPILEKACDDTHDRHLHVFEVGSGEGIQLATIASCALTNKSLRNVVFQPSETDPKGCKEVNETCHGLSNVFPCQQLHLDEGMSDVFNSACDVQELPNTRAIDVILAFNVIHIVPWQSVKALFSALDGHRYTFQSGRNVRLVFYGAFHEDGCCTSPGNKEVSHVSVPFM